MEDFNSQSPRKKSLDFDVIVIGAGQCGLSIGYHLKKAKQRFVIVDAAEQVGQSWRERYDSLRLFTPNLLNILPGAEFPPSNGVFPSKDEYADYLLRYAQYHDLPIQLNTRVKLLQPAQIGFEVKTSYQTMTAAQVVVAIGAFHSKRVPSFCVNLSHDVFQVHSTDYRRPSQMPAGADVLVVGAGNSGAQIAMELARNHKVYLSAGHSFYSSPSWLLESVWAWRLHRWRARNLHRYLKMRLPLPWPIGSTQQFFVPNFRRERRKLRIQLVPRAVAADGNTVELSDGQRLHVGAVVWATGFRPEYSWIKAPIIDENGSPMLEFQARAMRGLYFLGLRRQRTSSSSFILGVPSDAKYVAAMMEKERIGQPPLGDPSISPSKA